MYNSELCFHREKHLSGRFTACNQFRCRDVGWYVQLREEIESLRTKDILAKPISDRISIPPASMGLLIAKIPLLTLFLFIGELSLGEFHVESHVQSAFLVVVLVVGHSLVRFPHTRPGPRNPVSADLDRVTIEMLDLSLETDQSVHERDGDVGVQVVSLEELSQFSFRAAPGHSKLPAHTLEMLSHCAIRDLIAWRRSGQDYSPFAGKSGVVPF